MTIMFEQPSLISGAAIDRFRFITMDNTSAGVDADFEAAQTNGSNNEIPFGITTGASQDAPLDSANDFAAKEAGVSFEWLSPGAIALLKSGSGGWVRGNQLMSDSDGQGLKATTAKWVGALALESVSANEIGRVLVVPANYFTT